MCQIVSQNISRHHQTKKMMGQRADWGKILQPYFWYWLHLRPLASLMSSVMFLLPIVHWHVYYYYFMSCDSTFCECVDCACAKTSCWPCSKRGFCCRVSLLWSYACVKFKKRSAPFRVASGWYFLSSGRVLGSNLARCNRTCRTYSKWCFFFRTWRTL